MSFGGGRLVGLTHGGNCIRNSVKKQTTMVYAKIFYMTKKQGKIIPNGVVLEKHEIRTVVFLTELGYDIELLPPDQVKGSKTPDLKMNGAYWEMKAPKGKGKYLIQNTIHKALHQSPNIILDIRRLKILQAESLPKIEKEFKLSKSAKRMIVIKKGRKLIDLSK